MNRNLVVTAFILVCAAVLMLSSMGYAQSRITVDPGRIGTHVPLEPGETYTLPTHTFINETGRDLKVVVSTSDYQDDVRLLPPKDWFTIEPTERVVPANSEGQFQVTVSLPRDAPVGDYRVWFRFAGVPTAASGVVVAQTLEVSFLFEVAATAAAAPKEYTLTVDVEGGGGVKPEAGSHTYPEGTSVELLAAPDEGWGFERWEGDIDDTDNPQTSVTMDRDRNVTAVFTEREPDPIPDPGDDEPEPEPEPDEEEEEAVPGDEDSAGGNNSLPWIGAGALLLAMVLGGSLLWRKFSLRRLTDV